MSDGISITVEHGVGTVRIDRPETRNALNPDLMELLAGALETLDADERARCLVIAGSEEVFASGTDPRLLADPDGIRAVEVAAAGFWPRLAAIGKPTVAAVSGWALAGGCELAFACDMAIAAEKSQFGQPEVTIGVIPGGGATQRLTRAIGRQRAMELVLTGRRFTAEQAYAWGLLNSLAKRSGWQETAFDLAHAVASRAPLAVRLGKQAILAAEREPLDQGLETERRLLAKVIATEDRIEGVEALLEGRPPRFEGR